MESYICQLKSFIDVESDAQNKQIEDIWALPLEERIELGHTINNVTVFTVMDGIDWARRGFAFLQLPFNESNLRPGSRIRLHKGVPEENYFSCEVVREHPGYYEIKASYGCNLSNITHCSSEWFVDPDRVDLRHLLKNTVDCITSTPLGNDIFGQLKGVIPPFIEAFDPSLKRQYREKYGFNDTQADAFVNALHCSNYYTIQGPPGTGKTWVLAYLALTLAQQGLNILVSAFTHRAINNALKKVRSLSDYSKLFKIGPIEQAEDLIAKPNSVGNYEQFILSPYNSLDRGLIVGASPMSLRSKRVGALSFDVAIIDEAGQLTQPLAIGIMLSCRKTIWIGDHKQMPPVLVASHDKKEIARSAFECLTEKHEGAMLETTYRMNEMINSIPSRYFYRGRLKSASNVSKRTLDIIVEDKRFDFLSNPKMASLFVETKHSRCKVQSKMEALVVRQLTEVLVNAGVPACEIGVVTPYRAQTRLIRHHLAKIHFDDPSFNPEDVVVDTVERMQGQEKEVVFFSLVLSNIDHISHGFDFYFNLNRWNVGMTRAKSKMIWIGNPSLFKQLEVREKENPHLKVFSDIIKELPKIPLGK
ncbi:AAA family ATPase [Halosquirtibacter laminarini]|uniref:AAA family ATPase n=1 Tax=Halosquirtibacter laminarini TaxID=3374600 RepID=A0AC61NIU2_9BACT|nr:AAA family ATPase [Prolixibacteraceae bacterium]